MKQSAAHGKEPQQAQDRRQRERKESASRRSSAAPMPDSDTVRSHPNNQHGNTQRDQRKTCRARPPNLSARISPYIPAPVPQVNDSVPRL
jgi:hypothetical protein